MGVPKGLSKEVSSLVYKPRPVVATAADLSKVLNPKGYLLLERKARYLLLVNREFIGGSFSFFG